MPCLPYTNTNIHLVSSHYANTNSTPLTSGSTTLRLVIHTTASTTLDQLVKPNSSIDNSVFYSGVTDELVVSINYVSVDKNRQRQLLLAQWSYTHTAVSCPASANQRADRLTQYFSLDSCETGIIPTVGWTMPGSQRPIPLV